MNKIGRKGEGTKGRKAASNTQRATGNKPRKIKGQNGEKNKAQVKTCSLIYFSSCLLIIIFVAFLPVTCCPHFPCPLFLSLFFFRPFVHSPFRPFWLACLLLVACCLLPAFSCCLLPAFSFALSKSLLDKNCAVAQWSERPFKKTGRIRKATRVGKTNLAQPKWQIIIANGVELQEAACRI
jgi:hypothetical protein